MICICCNTYTHSCTIPLYTSYYIQLTNVKDCLARGFIKEGETPLEVAAQQLIKDNINVSFTKDMYIRFTFCTAHLTWYYHNHRSFILLVAMIPTHKLLSYPSIFSRSMEERLWLLVCQKLLTSEYTYLVCLCVIYIYLHF